MLIAIFFVFVIFGAKLIRNSNWAEKLNIDPVRQQEVNRIEKEMFLKDFYSYDRDGYRKGIRNFMIETGTPPIGKYWREEYLELFDKVNRINKMK